MRSSRWTPCRPQPTDSYSTLQLSAGPIHAGAGPLDVRVRAVVPHQPVRTAHKPDHHLPDTPVTRISGLRTQLRVDLCGGFYPLGGGLLDGQERLRAAARRSEVVE